MKEFCKSKILMCVRSKYNSSCFSKNEGLVYKDKEKFINSFINNNIFFNIKYNKFINNYISYISFSFYSFDEVWNFFNKCFDEDYYFIEFSLKETKHKKYIKIYPDSFSKSHITIKNSSFKYFDIIFSLNNKFDEKLSIIDIAKKLDYNDFIDFLRDNNIVKKQTQIL